MNIRDAKNQVKYTVRSYLTKNDAGQPVIPLERQRPIFLMGPPGIGKTAIMQQVADELGITVDNLYNIKKRALSALFQIAHKEL